MAYSVKLPPAPALDLPYRGSAIPEKVVRPVRTGEEATPTPVPALRAALRQWFATTAQEADGDPLKPEEVQAILNEINHLWAEAGPAFAEAVQRQEARTYYRETGQCPFCGQAGVFHDPQTHRDLRAALALVETEVRSGKIGRGPILVRGRPLADWLSLDTLAWWLRRAKR